MIKKNSTPLNRVAQAFSVLLIASSFCSCEKKEMPVPAHDAGSIVTSSVKMEANYLNQLFLDLETNTIVQQNIKTDWDLGFESTVAGNRVILNSAKLMFAAVTNQTDLLLVTDTIGLHFKWDIPSGNLDSTAIGDWNSTKNVVIIDRGYNELGVHQGFKKILFKNVTHTEYEVQFANLDGSDEVVRQVVKVNAYNFTFLSLDNKIVNIQPEKENWDLAFTQYTHIFQGNPPIPYLVTGVLTNRNNVEVATVFDKEFTSITLADVDNYSFLTTINQIGYDWKEYSFNTSSYTVFSDKNYIIKSTEGKYFKLHFIDFYDDLGVKGTPTFEFQEL